MANVNWTDGSDNWTTSGDWSSGHVPGPADNVTIGQGAPQVTTNVGTVTSVTNSSTLDFVNGGILTTSSGFSNSGTLSVDDTGYGQGGSKLVVGGGVVNGGTINLGNSGLSSADAISAATISNTGTINLQGNGANQALLDVGAAAGFGSAGIVTGVVNLGGNAEIEFASGQITTIAGGATLGLYAGALIADAGSTTSNSALSGLTSVGGTLYTDDNTIVTSGGLTNTGTVDIDYNSYGDGGTHLTISGALTNSGTVNIGNNGLSISDEVSATSLNNTGTINLQGNGANQALLDITTSAGFGSAGIVTGTVNLGGNAEIEFASGQITTIAGGATLGLYAGALIADAGSTTSNSALSGLTSVGGTLYTDDNTIVTSGGLTNTGTVDIDNNGYGDGGTHLTISGALTNSGTVNIGNNGLSISDEISAKALSNVGTINLYGNGANQALLDIGAAAGFGSAGILTGTVNLGGNAEIEFASGQITTIAGGATLGLYAGALIADAGSTTSNSALSGLTSVGGTLYTDDNTVVTSGGLTNTGTVDLDNNGYGDGGTHLTISGTLTNGGTVNIGNNGLSISDEISAKALSNVGTINLYGNGANQALLDIGAAAGFGSAGIVTGTVNLGGNAEIEFASGQITTIAGGATLGLYAGALIADAGSTTSNSALSGLTSVGGTLYTDDNTIVTSGGLTNTGTVDIDNNGYGDGGTHLTISGTLTNGGTVNIGNNGLSISDEISAKALSNVGTINLYGNGANQALLDIGAAAGFGSAGILTGTVNLGGNAEIEFTSGQITTIAGGATLGLYAGALIADAGSTTSNSALSGLTSVGGTLYTDDNTIVTSGGLTNTGTVDIDNNGYGDGGTHLTISGALTNSGTVNIGNNGLSISDEVSATSLNNTGTINLQGNGANQALLDITTSAGFGSAGIVTGTVNLGGNAEIEFASGQITTIAAGASLGINGANAFVADAGSTTSNSALSGLTTVSGSLATNDTTIVTSGGLTNTHLVYIDATGYGFGGSDLTVGGTLSNASTIYVGNTGLSISDVVSAHGLTNLGTIEMQGAGANQTLLKISGVADNIGSLYLSAESAVTVAGTFEQDPSGILGVGLAGTTAGQFSTVATTGNVNLLGGSLSVGLQGVTLAAGQTFDLMTFTSGELSGMFNNLIVSGAVGDGTKVNLIGNLTAGLVYNDALGEIQLQIVATPNSTADTWTAATGNWSTSADWSAGTPTFYSDVTIGSGSTANVTLSTDASINSLTINASDQLATASGTDLSIGAGLSVGSGASLSIGGQAFIDSASTNSGTIAVIGSILDIRGAASGPGGYAISSGATLELAGGGAANASQFTDAAGATLDFAGGSFALNGGGVSLGGTTEIAGGGTVDLTGNLTVAAFEQSTNGVLSGTGVMTVTGSASFTTTDGPLATPEGVYQLGSGTTLLEGVSTLSGQNTSTGSAHSFNLDGGRVLENQGTFNWTGGDIFLGANVGGGILQNDSGGTFDIESDRTIFKGVSGTDQVINSGTFEKTLTTGTTHIQDHFINTGSLVVKTGTLEFDGVFSDSGTGTVVVSSGATLDLFGGGSTTSGAITVLSGGTLILSNGTQVSGTTDDGLVLVESGGVAIGTIVSSGGVETISSAGIASGTKVSSGGVVKVSAHGVGSGSILSNGGVEYVASSGVTISDTVLAGGTEAVLLGGLMSAGRVTGAAPVSAGGVTSAVTLVGGGSERVSSGGKAVATIISSGGVETALSSGVVSGAVISAGGSLVVSSGGLVSGTTILSGGGQHVSSGGVATGTIILSSGTDYVLASGTDSGAVVSSGGLLLVSSGGESFAATVSSAGTETISSGGLASGTTLSAGGIVRVSSAGATSGSIISSGGVEYLFSSGSAVGDIVRAGGTEAVTSGGVETLAYVSGGAAPVSAGGVASNTTLVAGGAERVSSGGKAVGTIISSGGTETVLSSGVASNANVSSGGSLVISSGGLASATAVLAGGGEHISAGGTATGTIVSSGGTDYVLSSGLASGATVSSGGSMLISLGGTASGTVIGSGGSVHVSSGGSDSGTIISSGGTDYVLSGGSDSGASLLGGVLQVSGGTALAAVVSSGGDEIVISSGGLASGTQVSSGGQLRISSGATGSASVISSGGVAYLVSGVSIDDMVIKGGTEAVLGGGVEISAFVSGGGASPISAGGAASAVTVIAGGTQRVSSGGTASGTIVSSGGSETVLSSGTADNALVLSGGSLIVSSGGVVSGGFTISGGTATVSAPVAAGQTVSFSGAGGVLALALTTSSSFAAAISGFNLTTQKIDLLGFAYNSTTESATWAQSGTSGTLTVTDGGQVAVLDLIGAYVTSNFVLSNDGHSGTYVVDPPIAKPAPIPHATFVQAMATFGAGGGASAIGSINGFTGSGLLGAVPLVPAATGSAAR